MTMNKDSDVSRDSAASSTKAPSEKLSRREFAKSTVAAGAAAIAISGVGRAEAQEADAPASPTRPAAKPVSNEWLAGRTIPAEYYYETEHYRKDERYIAENFWLLADHVSRIPDAGDYFVFAFGMGESVIVVRDESGTVRAFNNVCRHRGSRLCRHDEDPRPGDERLSVRQPGESGNTKVFRCPYHAWLYDLDGSLIEAYDVHDDFDMDANGLLPCHVRVEEGHIFVNFSRSDTPPAFDAVTTYGFRDVGSRYGLAGLKVGARLRHPIRANWKLVLENFLECYHCGPSHKNLVTTHNWDYRLSDNRRKRHDSRMADWLGPELAADMGEGSGGLYDGELNPEFLTGSLDGKPLAPFLPGISDWSHDTALGITGYSTGYWQAYDDHVVVVRFTPRGPELTDGEILWLVHPQAEAGKDYDPEKLKALWEITLKEDAWIVENNHAGIKSIGYQSGRYSVHEAEPSAFVAWYMQEIVRA
jgi:phenylpropionate dioxygenase-like ring-hydroxylating dioxygenase large terminal subunit